MEHFPSVLTRAESDGAADRIEQHFERHGFGLWALEIPGVTPFAGFVGLAVPTFEAHFTPCVEIGWRLAPEHWGFSYATDAAREVLNFAFADLGLAEVVSFTVQKNQRSRRVMERIGMTHNPADDFEYPNQPEPWRHHVLYRIGSNRRAG
jgi:RimJ/RimL family protein N-acetyltransferase